MTPEYEPPAFDYSDGLCYIPPRKASMVFGHDVGLFYWDRGIPVYGSFCNATYFVSISITNIHNFPRLLRPTLERVGRILWSAGIRLHLPVLVLTRALLR
eukprot:2846204-Pleurochrysis_carterae.AAC.2